MAKLEKQPVAANPSPGIDAQVDPQKIKARAALLVQHGTDPLLAEKIAEDAEHAQLVRDAAFAKLQSNRDEAAAAASTQKGGE